MVIRFIVLCIIFGATLAIIPQLAFFGRFLLLTEIARSFPEWLLVALGVTVLLTFIPPISRQTHFRRIVRIVVLFEGIFIFSHLSPFLLGTVSSDSTRTHSVSIAVSNVEFGWAPGDKLLALFEGTLPDILVVSEYTHAWSETTSIDSAYSNKVLFPGIAAEGAAIFSKHALELIGNIMPQGLFSTPAVMVIPEEGRAFHLIAVHAPPPHGDSKLVGRRKYFELLEKYIRSLDTSVPLIVAGDLNTTPLSTSYKSFVRNIGLSNAAVGLGYFRTWELKSTPFFGAFIDHVLIRGAVSAIRVRTLKPFGSDHLPLLVDFRL